MKKKIATAVIGLSLVITVTALFGLTWKWVILPTGTPILIPLPA